MACFVSGGCIFMLLVLVVSYNLQETTAKDCHIYWDLPDLCDVNNTCPADKPYIWINGSRTECRHTCGPGLVGYDFTCIPVEKCKRAIIHDGQCLYMCPEGLVYLPQSFRELLTVPSASGHEGYGDGPEFPVYDHVKGEENMTRCQRISATVLAASKYFLMACFLVLVLFLYFHPSPICIVKMSQLIRFIKRNWRDEKKEEGLGADDDDEPMLSGNLSVQNLDDDVIVV